MNHERRKFFLEKAGTFLGWTWVLYLGIFAFLSWAADFQKARYHRLDALMPPAEDLRRFVLQPGALDSYKTGRLIRYYEQVHAFFPEIGGVEGVVAYGEQVRGRPKRARSAWLRAVKRYPQDFWSRFNLGRSFFLEGNYQKAVAALQSALAISPERILELTGTSKVLILLEQLAAGGRGSFEERLRQAYLDAHLLLALSFFAQEDDQNMMVHSLRLLELEGNQGPGNLLCGAAAYRLGNPLKAGGYLQTWLKSHPRSPSALYLLGQMAERSGRPGLASALLKRAGIQNLSPETLAAETGTGSFHLF